MDKEKQIPLLNNYLIVNYLPKYCIQDTFKIHQNYNNNNNKYKLCPINQCYNIKEFNKKAGSSQYSKCIYNQNKTLLLNNNTNKICTNINSNNKNINNILYSINNKLILFELISLNFLKIIKNNYSINLVKNTYFDDNTDSNFNIVDYLSKVSYYCEANVNTIIYSIILLDNICKSKRICLSYKNTKKLYFVSLMLSLKLLQDKTYKDRYYCKLVNIALQEYIFLEFIFIEFINYKLYVNNFLFNVYKKAFFIN